jgi:Novel STAND NTPase 1
MTSDALPNVAARGVPKSPYRGIEEFRYVDAPIFFGRDFEARRLLRLVTIYRGVLLYGDSGVGKSSLVNAKVMPLAVDDGYAPERVRVQPVRGAEFVVERIAPTDEANAYLPSLFDDGKGTRRVSVAADDFLARLQERCRVGHDSATYPLIVIDQFEELVTLTEQASRRDAAAARAAHDATVDVLLRILRDDTLRVKLLFVFREDYYAKLTRFFAQTPTLIDNYQRLEPLRSSQLDDIINGPFRTAKFDHELPTDVAELLKSELAERGDLLILSEVQIACLRLWHAPDPKALLAKQRIGGLLETYFSEAITALPSKLQYPAVALLDELVTDSGTRNVVSADTLIDALQKVEVPPDITRQTLEALDKTAHVIRRQRRNDVEVYEIVSEFLVPWIMRRKMEAEERRELEARTARTWKSLKWISAALTLAIVAFIVVNVIREKSSSQGALRSQISELEAERDKFREERDYALQRMDDTADRPRLSETVAQIKSLEKELEAARNEPAEKQLSDLHMRYAEVIAERDEAVVVQNIARNDAAKSAQRVKALESELESVRAERDKLIKEVENSKRQ